ncbi:MAG: UDP-N-acetylglucosamine 1-carboxyvinyltransferase [Oscillospiraceae bacterium]|nr:UDP-N-acetylglucosamine 1-carboxyvinyltransferase [Oscillospiraceae bacterium]
MRIFRIHGGSRLSGEVKIDSAKNSALPILAACMMTEEPVTLLDVPDIEDVSNMLAILRGMGASVTREDGAVTVCAKGDLSGELPAHLEKTLRASVFLVGPMLSRTREVTFGYPGGCEIGLRPIDLHERGLRALGVVIDESGGRLHCDGGSMRGAEIHFDYPSVGATENIMMAAALLPGKTVIHNAAREPEIADLARFMNACGAKISGAGRQIVTIHGVKRMHGVEFRPIADRIAAGTMLAAAAITGGDLRVVNAPAADMVAQITKLRCMGCDIKDGADGLRLRAPRRLRSFGQIQTQPHPGFPTDMQAPMFTLATVADGVSLLVETVFESRFQHARDLQAMGADVTIRDRVAVVRGVSHLHGARVKAHDLRSGAALTIAALAAEGETEIEQISQIDRGYAALEVTLGGLGARITREDDAM